MSVFGGVEGGATHSTLVLFNEKSEALTTVEGPGTNLFQIGMDETCHRISEMICQALKNLGKFHSDLFLIKSVILLAGFSQIYY